MKTRIDKRTTAPSHTIAGLVRRTFLTLASLALLTATARAQVPTMISYQGRVLMNNVNFDGNGQFKFALVQGAGPTLLWKNDGSPGNTEPTAAVTLPVANGLVTTVLGDTTLPNMTALPVSAFANADVRLRVWFNGGAGFQQLAPDQRIVSVGYALMAATVPDGAITAAKLANGAVTSAKIAGNAIGATQIAPDAVNSSDIADGSILGLDIANNTLTGLQIADVLELGSPSVVGRLDVFRTTTGTPALTLNGSSTSGILQLFDTDGTETILAQGSYSAGFGSQLLMRDASGDTTIQLTGDDNGSGYFALYNAAGSQTVRIEADEVPGDGGQITLRNNAGATTITLDANQGTEGVITSGSLRLHHTDGTETLVAQGAEAATGAQILMRQANGATTIVLDAESGATGGGSFAMNNAAGTQTITLDADHLGGLGTITCDALRSETLQLFDTDGTETFLAQAAYSPGFGSQLLMRDAAGDTTIQLTADDAGSGYFAMYNAAGFQTVRIEADEVVGDGARITLRNNAGVETIRLDANAGTEGRITTEVLTITGGSDLSENFDVNAAQDELQPGMIVSIDPKNPGELVLAREVYDNKVAGIVSGAGGVKPGMLMGQAGTKADGKHPIALTGRVYCQVDASFGAIEPGDMITTSSTPGHGMKATDRERAFGSIIGKAMTGLAEGKGLVLVLVNLQ